MMNRADTIGSLSKKKTGSRPSRLVIYPKDIQLITGKSHRSAQNMLRNIRIALHKEKDQLISFTEFCQFTGMKEDMVYEFLFAKSH